VRAPVLRMRPQVLGPNATEPDDAVADQHASPHFLRLRRQLPRIARMLVGVGGGPRVPITASYHLAVIINDLPRRLPDHGALGRQSLGAFPAGHRGSSGDATRSVARGILPLSDWLQGQLDVSGITCRDRH
jgi:hypothetical protein